MKIAALEEEFRHYHQKTPKKVTTEQAAIATLRFKARFMSRLEKRFGSRYPGRRLLCLKLDVGAGEATRRSILILLPCSS
jgi:hypothetical protein